VRSKVQGATWVVAGGLAAGIAAYCWLAAGLRPFTAPIDAAVALPSALVAALAWRSSVSGPSVAVGQVAPTWRQAAPWAALVGLLAALELAAYLSSPRRDHPTLSSVADTVMGTHLGRAALFAGWLGLGWVMFSRRAPE
jgi:hypothetical protein